jgi:hypothetical protein
MRSPATPTRPTSDSSTTGIRRRRPSSPATQRSRARNGGRPMGARSVGTEFVSLDGVMAAPGGEPTLNTRVDLRVRPRRRRQTNSS